METGIRPPAGSRTEVPMPTVSSIPVTVTPEAAERVAELGLQTDLDRMLEHTRQTVTGLRRLDVVLDPPYDTGDEPYITIEALRDPSFRLENDPTWRQWSEWTIFHFPPDVLRHINMLILYVTDDAR
jgi:hypothetical protein